MGGVILLFILVLLVTILATPALRARLGRRPPPVDAPPHAPHEVVVHQLDDHRGKKPGDEGKSS
jgi:hypothetical protein